MKKIVIIAAVIVSSALTAFSVNKKEDKTTADVTRLKIERANFPVTNASTARPDIASAD